MRRLLLTLAVLGCLLASSGCWFFDAEHNRRHWKMMEKDIEMIHADLDFLLALEQPTPFADDWAR